MCPGMTAVSTFAENSAVKSTLENFLFHVDSGGLTFSASCSRGALSRGVVLSGAGCGARCRLSQRRHRAVSGLRPAAIGPPARSLADGRSEFSAEQSRSLRHESAARTEETPRRSAVRRCALGTVGSQRLTVGRDRNGLCAFAALRPPHLQSSGANASRECERLFENQNRQKCFLMAGLDPAIQSNRHGHLDGQARA